MAEAGWHMRTVHIVGKEDVWKDHARKLADVVLKYHPLLLSTVLKRWS